MLTVLAWPRRINFLAEHASFFRSHLSYVFKLNKIIPKKVLSNDIPSLRAIRDVIKRNGVVAFAPEGFASVFGDNQPAVPGTGRFLQVFGIPHRSRAAISQPVNSPMRTGPASSAPSSAFSSPPKT